MSSYSQVSPKNIQNETDLFNKKNISNIIEIASFRHSVSWGAVQKI